MPFDPENPPVEEAPAWRRSPTDAAPPSLETVSRATSSKVIGPGIVPQVRPMEALDLALQERFGKKFVASGGTASLDEAIKKKFAKKEMLLAKNLATVKRAYEIASEWAEQNKIELRVGNPAVAA